MTTAATPSEGWAVELTGHRIDLDDLREMLAPPFEPWVEDYEDGGEVRLLLRYGGWATIDDTSALAADASFLVERLNGAKPLTNSDARPIALGRFFKFAADGSLLPFVIAASGHITFASFRARGRGSVVSDEPPPPPQPSQLQNWLQAADTSDDRSDLFVHIARCDNWYDIYKAAEIIRRMAGSKKKLHKLLSPDQVDWDRVWQTANTNRHARDLVKYPPPSVPATLDEARGMILKAAKLVA